MTQIGLNLGPRNARVLGWAKSFVKNLSTSEMIEKDNDIIGASSFIWSLIKSTVPTDISEHVEDFMEKEGLPRIATRNVSKGLSFYSFIYIFANILNDRYWI